MAGGGGDDVWLISYADLMTLLFGFFVLMYTLANQDDKDQWEKVRREFAQYFGGAYVNPYAEMAEEIKKVFEDTPFVDEIDIVETDNGLEVTFRSTVLFDSGRSTLNPEAREPMKVLVDVITERMSEFGFRLYIEGHTDDVPISTAFYPSNWELSAKRATSVLRLFEENNVNPRRIQAIAYGESRPLVPNRDEDGFSIHENQARNRRVVLRLVSEMQKPPKESAASDFVTSN